MAYFGYNPNVDSPAFTKQPAITAGNTTYFDFLFRESSSEPASKYVPLNYIFIQNNSAQRVNVTIKDIVNAVAAGGQLELGPADIGGYSSFSVTNTGGADIAAGELLITVSRKGVSGTRDIVQGFLERILGGGFSGS